jgi:hypothetical protein
MQQNRALLQFTASRNRRFGGGLRRRYASALIAAYNFAKRLKTLSDLTPHEYICKIWTEEPNRFKFDPTHLTSGLYILAR